MSGIVVKNKSETTLDKIRKYYLQGPDAVVLSDKQDAIRVNVYKAWNLMINYHSREQAIKTIMTETGCSRAQAYRYVSDSMSVFGNPQNNQKEAKRYLIEEDLMRLQQRAIKEKDGNLELAVIKQRIKIGGFDKDTDPKFNPEKLQAQVYILKPHPAAVKMMEASREGGLFDFNNVQADDVEYQVIPDSEDDEE
jgi:hypothetical protein